MSQQTSVERLKIEIDKREYFAAMAMQGMLANITQGYGVPNVNEKAMKGALKRVLSNLLTRRKALTHGSLR